MSEEEDANKPPIFRLSEFKVKKEDLSGDLDLISWLKAEMEDALERVLMNDAYGPLIWGYNEKGEPNFEVFRNAAGKWDLRPSAEYAAKPGTLGEAFMKRENNDQNTPTDTDAEPPAGGQD